MEIEVKVAAIMKIHSENVQILLVEKSDEDNKKMLSFTITDQDGYSIAMTLDNMKMSRPFVHDLMKNFLERYDISLQKIVINALKDGIFFDEIYHKKGDQSLTSDSRPSDAIALAVRFGCPIFVDTLVFEQMAEEDRKFNEGLSLLEPKINDSIMEEVLENFSPEYGQ